jgi:molybdate-binding protein
VFKAALSPHLQPGEHKLISAHRRVQGWMTRRSATDDAAHAVDGWTALQRQGTRLVNRQPGSGTRLLLDHLLADKGLTGEAIEGYQTRVEHTHVAVAAMIAGGSADIGLGVEAVAQDFGLQFEPLVEEEYYLVCLKDQLDREPVLRLRHLLAQASWSAELRRLPGYVSEQPGQVLSLVQALPWWHFDEHAPSPSKGRAKSAK